MFERAKGRFKAASWHMPAIVGLGLHAADIVFPHSREVWPGTDVLSISRVSKGETWR